VLSRGPEGTDSLFHGAGAGMQKVVFCKAEG